MVHCSPSSVGCPLLEHTLDYGAAVWLLCPSQETVLCGLAGARGQGSAVSVHLIPHIPLAGTNSHMTIPTCEASWKMQPIARGHELS